MSADSTGWPLLTERPHSPPPVRRLSRRPRGRPAWILAVLAFVCGALVSGAAFSIGWRHLAQSGTAAQNRLATETARAHRLDASLATARERETRLQGRLAAATASALRLATAAEAVSAQASAAERAAQPVAGDAGTIAGASARVSRELKTLSDYLTTTPAGQIDGGYVAAQIAYLTRQLDSIQTSGGDLGSVTASFRSAVQKLAVQGAALTPRH